MNRTLRLAAASLAAGIVIAPVAQAQVVPNTPESRAVAAAKQGPEQLRRFIQRTRALYNLHFEDFRRYLP